MGDHPGFDNERFFRDLAYEMTGHVKEPASLIIDFRKELTIHPPLPDIALKYIPDRQTHRDISTFSAALSHISITRCC